MIHVWGKALARNGGSARQQKAPFWGSSMKLNRVALSALLVGLAVALAGCGGLSSGDSGLFGRKQADAVPTESQVYARSAREKQEEAIAAARYEKDRNTGSTLSDLFVKRDNPNTTVEVNKYIWAAALDVLNFLPIESVDPFTGVIVTGYGKPPGGGRAYRATIYVQDPALDARSLKIAMQTSGGGAVAPETVRAIEDAILTRARQLRIQDTKL